MTRLGRHQLIDLLDQCRDRRRAIVEFVADNRLASGGQLCRQFFFRGASGTADRRHCNRELAWLVEHRLLHRLHRQIGGRRAGSEGFVYSLGIAGRRAVDYWRGEGVNTRSSDWEPGDAFVAHSLARTELLTELRGRERHGSLEVIEWQSEPASWRSHVGPLGAELRLKPDAFVIVASGEFEYLWFIEIDRATQRLGAIRRKVTSYVNYAASGIEQRRHHVFPHVMWVAPTRERALRLDEISGAHSNGVCRFVATTDEEAAATAAGGST